MIGNPLVLLGLLAVGVPVLIHLLSRHPAAVLRFPTLRFLPASRLMPTRRTRIDDLLLLLVRSLVIAFAALALARPYFQTASRRAMSERTAAATLARVIIV